MEGDIFVNYPKDLGGFTFGRLTAIKMVAKPEHIKLNNTSYWQCICECGNEKIVARCNLVKNNTTSCGCMHKKVMGQIRRATATHDMTKSRFYRIWANMKYRCNNPNCHAYENYGGRGIKVSQSWHTFDNFKVDMYESYLAHVRDNGEAQTTIERIDANGDYCLQNCCWATKQQQSQNKRTTISVNVDGITYNSIVELAREYKLDYHTVLRKYHKGVRGIDLTSQ